MQIINLFLPLKFKIMRYFLVSIFFLFSAVAIAQYNNKDSNHIGISAGVSQLSLFSDQFNATPGQGFIGGFSLRGNYYNNWQAVYGMHFSQSSFSLESITNKEIDFTMEAVQIYFCFSYRVIENHLNLEIGPVLQVNGKLKIDKEDELALTKRQSISNRRRSNRYHKNQRKPLCWFNCWNQTRAFPCKLPIRFQQHHE
jgi:hypothetical protein